MKIVFITQSYDLAKPLRGNVIRWVEELSNHPSVSQISVLCREKPAAPPMNSTVTFKYFGDSKKLRTLLNFYYCIIHALLNGFTHFFIHQGGPYSVLLFPIKLIPHTKVFQWKAHRVIDFYTWFGAHVSVSKIFTPNKTSLDINLSKIKTIGHGIDVELFTYKAKDFNSPPRFFTSGRITPSKNICLMLDIIYHFKSYYKKEIHLDIVGGAIHRNDLEYRRNLDKKIDRYAIGHLIHFNGVVTQAELAIMMQNYNFFLNFSETGLDKALLESMSTGCIPFVTHNHLHDLLPKDLLRLTDLQGYSNDTAKICQKINEVINLDKALLSSNSSKFSEHINEQHSIKGLVKKIAEEMNN